MTCGDGYSVVVAVAQQKGGTGKTTTVATLGDALQRRCSRRVLLVDLDPQASLTEWLTTPDDPVAHGVEDLLVDQVDDVRKVLVRLRAGLDLLPATNGLLDAAAAIERRSFGRESALARVLAPLRDNYNLILVDGPPRLDGLTINSLFAADRLLVPMETSTLSMYAARDLLALVREVEQARGRNLPLLGLMPTSVRRSTNSSEILAALRERYPLLPSIRQTVRVEEAPAVHRLLLDYAPECSAAEDYLAAAEVVALALGWEQVVVRRESGFLRAAVQSATAAMEEPSRSQVAGASDTSAPQSPGAVPLDAGTGGARSGERKVGEDRCEEHDGASEVTSMRTDEQRRAPRDPRELAELLTDPAGYARQHSQRRVGGLLRTVDGRISAEVAATFAAHCDADLGKISQADVVEVLLRAYLRDVGVEIRRPFA